ncbi:MAG: CRTAC1 family protein [Armatimonadota bacterium]
MICHPLLRRLLPLLLLLACGASLAQYPFVFRDVAQQTGLLPEIGGIAGHAAAWGDYNGDGWPDLYIATFGGKPYGSKLNQLFLNVGGRFRLDPQPVTAVLGRASGSIFADLDNDGDLDLYLSNHAIDPKDYGEGTAHYLTPNKLFRNDNGRFTDVTEGCGASPGVMGMRSAAALDYDGDGLLDLLVGEDYFQGSKSRSRLFHNLGNLRFADVTEIEGLPPNVTGFGVAAGDVNGDGWPDVLLGGRYGGNRLFINDGDGRFREPPLQYVNFAWQYSRNTENTACGVCFGDVNRDGRLDAMIGSHFSDPWQTGGVAIRMYLNLGVKDGWPDFADATAAVGLPPLQMKSPHIEVQDFDNDGWPDLYTSVVKFANDRCYPMIYRNPGAKDGIPRFYEDVWRVNNWPTAVDRRANEGGDFYRRLLVDEHKVFYASAAPTVDFDHDGRMDLFLASWWVYFPTMLLRNETMAGNWLQVAVKGDGEKVNTQGIGSQVRLYVAGKLGQPEALLGMGEVAVGYGYASGQEAMCHFGLGNVEVCDVEVTLPHGNGRYVRRGVKAWQRITLTNEDRAE